MTPIIILLLSALSFQEMRVAEGIESDSLEDVFVPGKRKFNLWGIDCCFPIQATEVKMKVSIIGTVLGLLMIGIFVLSVLFIAIVTFEVWGPSAFICFSNKAVDKKKKKTRKSGSEVDHFKMEDKSISRQTAGKVTSDDTLHGTSNIELPEDEKSDSQSAHTARESPSQHIRTVPHHQ